MIFRANKHCKHAYWCASRDSFRIKRKDGQLLEHRIESRRASLANAPTQDEYSLRDIGMSFLAAETPVIGFLNKEASAPPQVASSSGLLGEDAEAKDGVATAPPEPCVKPSVPQPHTPSELCGHQPPSGPQEKTLPSEHVEDLSPIPERTPP